MLFIFNFSFIVSSIPADCGFQTNDSYIVGTSYREIAYILAGQELLITIFDFEFTKSSWSPVNTITAKPYVETGY